MKQLKLINIILITLLLFSCNDKINTENNTFKSESELIREKHKLAYGIIIIDSCEYILSTSTYSPYNRSLTHKGNCKNHKK